MLVVSAVPFFVISSLPSLRPFRTFRFGSFVSLLLARVAGVKRGMGNFGARERVGRSSLLPRAWSRALIPFPFSFERLPRRLRCFGF